MTLTRHINDLAEQVITRFAQKEQTLCIAESCTGGLISGALTSIAGASAVFERGFVSYSPLSKTELLGILPEKINRFGLVSAEIAEEMAEGALSFSHADLALSVTGLAGPDGGTDATPIGLAFLGIAKRDKTRFHLKCQFNGTRHAIQQQIVVEALNLLLSIQG